jgi:hypothetical protein
MFETMSKTPKKDFEVHGCRCFVERCFVGSALDAMSPTLASSAASVELCWSLGYHAIAIQHSLEELRYRPEQDLGLCAEVKSCSLPGSALIIVVVELRRR